jgi:hypothetical protein
MVARGVVATSDNSNNYRTVLQFNMNAYLDEFVNRQNFIAKYPRTLTPEQFVEALYSTTGIALTAGERQAALTVYAGSGRAGVLQRIVLENQNFIAQNTNAAFVLMQYFGYLRRNPNDAPDVNFDGYNLTATIFGSTN